MPRFRVTQTLSHEYEAEYEATAEQEEAYWAADPHALVDFADSVNVPVEEV